MSPTVVYFGNTPLLGYYTLFKDETKLDINYIPSRLLHRLTELNLLSQFFSFILRFPGRMSQRVLIAGRVGTGKTVLTQFFGLQLLREARKRNINLHYVHANCREYRGNMSYILQKILHCFYPNFPVRGYSLEELLQTLMQVLDDENAHVILTLDELEYLIQKAGSDPVYQLTRLQESRSPHSPHRLSLICILRRLETLEKLDESTRSTLQHNIIVLDEYSKQQLEDILNDRVELAFKPNTVPWDTISLVAELAEAERGNARYAIELLWRAGKYADANQLNLVTPECVRMAAASIYPNIRKSDIVSLSLHERLFLLGIAKAFNQTGKAFLSTGEAEEAYKVVCEELDEKPRGHTKLWEYLQKLAVMGIIKTRKAQVKTKGRTTLISLPWIPAEMLEKELYKSLNEETVG
jgi:cell division control protein 6